MGIARATYFREGKPPKNFGPTTPPIPEQPDETVSGWVFLDSDGGLERIKNDNSKTLFVGPLATSEVSAELVELTD